MALHQLNYRRIALRNERGSMGVLMSSMILISILGIGAFAADVSHNAAVRSELQSATDAAALAGAKALVDQDTASNAEQHALDVAAANYADGKSVTADDTTQIMVEINNSEAEEVGSCQVTASRTINNWLATMFGRPTDTITVVSKASASTSVDRIDGGLLFPLAVSFDAVGSIGNGQSVTITSSEGVSAPQSFDLMTAIGSLFIQPAMAKNDNSNGNGGGSGGSNANSGGSSGGSTTSTTGGTTGGDTTTTGGTTGGTTTTTGGTTGGDTTTTGGTTSGGSTGGAPSKDQVGEEYPRLKDLKVGDTFHIIINSDKIDNGGWTSFTNKDTNADWLNHVVNINLGLEAPDEAKKEYVISDVTVGEPIFLTNGMKGLKDLGKDQAKLDAIKAKDVLYLPVIEGDKFNQSSPCIGWIAVKVKNVYVNNNGVVQDFETELLKAPVRGRKGDIPPVGGDASTQTTLESLSPSAVRLVQPG